MSRIYVDYGFSVKTNKYPTDENNALSIIKSKKQI